MSITYIETDKRGLEFTTAQRPSAKRVIPLDLYILGTMNTADKSISLLDVALRRRFKPLSARRTPLHSRLPQPGNGRPSGSTLGTY